MVDYKLNVTWLIWIVTIIRCLIAFYVELGNDEVYYYTYAVQPDWNHFDHPPLVGMLIRFFTLNLYGANTFSMRFGAIISAMFATGLSYRIGCLIRNGRTGFIAALLYTASIYTSVIAGLFILPDSPAVVFWLAAIYCMLKVVGPIAGSGDPNACDRGDNPKYLLLTGLLIGLAILSKVHGVFLWFGFGAYIMMYQRSLLRNMYLYLAILLTAIVVLPILFWNIEHDFINWRFHGERVAPAVGIQIRSFLSAVVGQFLYANPLVAILCAAAVAAIYRGGGFVDHSAGRLLLWCGLPIILVTTAVSLFRPVLPHWSGPGLIPMMLLAAAWADARLLSGQPWKFYRNLLNGSLRLMLGVLVLGVLLIRFYPGTLGNPDSDELGNGDFTLDMVGWRTLPSLFDEVRKQDKANGIMDADAPLVVHKWFPGGHLYFYVARPLGMRVVGHGTLNDLHKFAWLNEREGFVMPGQDAYFIVPSNDAVDATGMFADNFESVELATRIPQERRGMICRYWSVYRLKGARTKLGFVPDRGKG